MDFNKFTMYGGNIEEELKFKEDMDELYKQVKQKDKNIEHYYNQPYQNANNVTSIKAIIIELETMLKTATVNRDKLGLKEYPKSIAEAYDNVENTINSIIKILNKNIEYYHIISIMRKDLKFLNDEYNKLKQTSSSHDINKFYENNKKYFENITKNNAKVQKGDYILSFKKQSTDIYISSVKFLNKIKKERSQSNVREITSCDTECITTLFSEVNDIKDNINFDDINDAKDKIKKMRNKLNNILLSEAKYYVEKDSEVIKDLVKEHEQWLKKKEEEIFIAPNSDISKDVISYIDSLNVTDDIKKNYSNPIPRILERKDLTLDEKKEYMIEYIKMIEGIEKIKQFAKLLEIENYFNKINILDPNIKDDLVTKSKNFEEIIDSLLINLKKFDKLKDDFTMGRSYSDLGFYILYNNIFKIYVNIARKINIIIDCYNMINASTNAFNNLMSMISDDKIDDIYAINIQLEIINNNNNKIKNQEYKKYPNIIAHFERIHNNVKNLMSSYNTKLQQQHNLMAVHDASSKKSVSVPVPDYDTSSNESDSATGLGVDTIFNYKPTKEERKQERLEDLSENIGILATVGAVGGIGIVGLLGLLFSLLAPLCGLVICICLCLCIFYILRPKKV